MGLLVETSESCDWRASITAGVVIERDPSPGSAANQSFELPKRFEVGNDGRMVCAFTLPTTNPSRAVDAPETVVPRPYGDRAWERRLDTKHAATGNRCEYRIPR